MNHEFRRVHRILWNLLPFYDFWHPHKLISGGSIEAHNEHATVAQHEEEIGSNSITWDFQTKLVESKS